MNDIIPPQVREFCNLIGLNAEAGQTIEMLGEELWRSLLENPDDPEVKNKVMQKVMGRSLDPAYARSLTSFAAFYGFSKDTPPLLIEMKLESICIEFATLLKEVIEGKRQATSTREIVQTVVQGKPASS